MSIPKLGGDDLVTSTISSAEDDYLSDISDTSLCFESDATRTVNVQQQSTLNTTTNECDSMRSNNTNADRMQQDSNLISEPTIANDQTPSTSAGPNNQTKNGGINLNLQRSFATGSLPERTIEGGGTEKTIFFGAPAIASSEM